MLSRLTLRAPGPQPPLLDAVPPPASADLLRVVAQALHYLGLPESWPRLAAVTGRAFGMARLSCDRRPSAEAAGLPESLALLGFRDALLLQTTEGLSGEAILRVVAEETAAGRPVLLCGWPPAAPGPALLAGCAPGGLVCGHATHCSPAHPYLAAPAEGDLLLALGPSEGTEPEALLAAATAAARAAWESARPGCGDCYRAWLHLLSADVEPSAAAAAQAEAAFGALLEARTAARDFLEAILEDLPPLASSWAERAVGHYEQLFERLDPLAAALAPPGGPILWAHSEWRPETYRRLQEIAELDAEAVNCLRRSAEAEYAPEEE